MDIRIIEVKSEIGAGTRGSSLGIDALKIASLNKNSKLFTRYRSEQVQDENHLLYASTDTPHAKRIEGIAKIYERVSLAVSSQLKSGRFPLVLAADHASAGGTIAGIKRALPDKRLGVVWIDAHADLHSPYTTPSGNVHGMPLAVSLGIDNLECARNQPSSKAIAAWEKLKNIGLQAPKVLPEDVVFVALRDTEPEEEHIIAKHQIKNFSTEELKTKGAVKVCHEINQLLKKCDVIYISFDVDSMDSELVSQGTGTPVPNGLSPVQAQDLVAELLKNDKVCTFEIVEINPTLDNKGNAMAEAALSVLETACQTIEAYPRTMFVKRSPSERYSHFSNAGRLSVVREIQTN